ncbi:CDP-glycerol glycerophosphotransferase family protein [Bacillus subtilis]|uniref:CDP-glycerol glycerophosphotransferase family protein n=1 Tax=Bacillus subtilis TaxID=1423 RepID=A0A165AQ56_BACIU|nr:CDP-glycerol glycerophosphotransferase family protein [Bacillus subtilis]AXP50054.1 CDP-glycerol glycerophosphotransferase family protein [Bacillus subtilis subsp. subtilis]KIN54944.1 CDP-glycerol:poly(glycerophosphate) glycerophosphotransferase [Bacillus subtilis]KZD92517.1 CDP-glycerol:poly(glycerophosphate) glycerophosphotransferase [Bacillus subtilis]MBO3796114.1 CDP-glycerol glycerophosphotransferase family protein [Bacillus subtilis]MBU8611146.1 CDP-glycerol glycerophosphotransferase 
MKSKILMKYRSLLVRVYSIAFRIIGLLPRNEKLIIFESYSGKQFSCNPRAIFEYLEENKDKYDYRLIWSIDKRNKDLFDNLDVKYLKRFSLKWLWYMATAKYWITNSRLPLWIPKPRKTTYVQTWHGTPLKKLANDMDEVHMPGTTTEQYKKNFLKEASKWDYLISPNAYSTEIFRSAFQFKRTFIESGYPRNDFLHKENKYEEMLKIKDRLGIDRDKKIILYAPTWRDNSFYAKGKYKFNMVLDLESLKDQLSDEYILILRMHYLVSENINLTAYKGFAYDFSNHNDIRELYLISDILITDYSSVFFDFAGLNRPILFYVPDIEFYRDKLRGFYYDFEKCAPGPLLKTTEKVIEAIHKTQHYKQDENLTSFYDQFCYLEKGDSSKKVVEEILG